MRDTSHQVKRRPHQSKYVWSQSHEINNMTQALPTLGSTPPIQIHVYGLRSAGFSAEECVGAELLNPCDMVTNKKDAAVRSRTGEPAEHVRQRTQIYKIEER